MTAALGTEWWPYALMDEAMPAGRDNPDAWLDTLPDGRPFLAGGDDDGRLESQPLADGERVEFIRCDTYGQAELVIRRDGSWSVETPMPPEAEQVCALGGWQVDSLAETVEDCVDRLKEEIGPLCDGPDLFDGADGSREFDLSYYTFSEPIPFRFDAARRTFEPAGPPC
jgi:hypothetical protein